MIVLRVLEECAYGDWCALVLCMVKDLVFCLTESGVSSATSGMLFSDLIFFFLVFLVFFPFNVPTSIRLICLFHKAKCGFLRV